MGCPPTTAKARSEHHRQHAVCRRHAVPTPLNALAGDVLTRRSNVGDLPRPAQRNAALVEEAAAASQSLEDQGRAATADRVDSRPAGPPPAGSAGSAS
ncbi:hypothetical protein RSP822_14955 [Ralstonia solanacearum]|nr:hypothetical protein RSP822_14955 [Ralstonia solanacearum]